MHRANPIMLRWICILSLLAGACGDSTDPGDDGEDQTGEDVVFTGTVQNNTPGPVPSNARVLVAWSVSTGTDFTYVFGEGTIDATSGTFQVTLPGTPPTVALNADVLGVGIVFATTNSSITTGWDVEDIPLDDVIGAAGQYAVIYVADPAGAQALGDWTGTFDDGYTVGRGQEVTGSFDIFVPDAPDSIVLVIDDISNIDFVNWT